MVSNRQRLNMNNKQLAVLQLIAKDVMIEVLSLELKSVNRQLEEVTTMNEIKLSYRGKPDSVTIMDYSDCNNIRYCGTSFTWTSNPLVLDPFNSKHDAEEAAKKYFTGDKQ